MKSLILFIIFFLLFVLSLNADAESEFYPSTDKFAHVGVMYMFNTITYGTARKMGFDKTEAIIASVVMSSILGIGKELVDEAVCQERKGADCRGKFSPGDLAADALGIGMSVGTILVFDF